jgi:hypothetical protein
MRSFARDWEFKGLLVTLNAKSCVRVTAVQPTTSLPPLGSGDISQHGRPHARMMAWLTADWVATPGIDLADNATVRLNAENEP